MDELRSALTQSLDQFAKLFHARSNSEQARVGRVAHCHIIVEHYLIQFIKKMAPTLGDLRNLRLRFAQLIEIGAQIDKTASARFVSVAEIKALNELRNQFAHRLDFDAVGSPQMATLK